MRPVSSFLFSFSFLEHMQLCCTLVPIIVIPTEVSAASIAEEPALSSVDTPMPERP